MLMPLGAGASVNWLDPGKRKEGYCSEKDQIVQEWPASINARHSLSLKVVMPPGLSGWAGPRIMILY